MLEQFINLTPPCVAEEIPKRGRSYPNYRFPNIGGNISLRQKLIAGAIGRVPNSCIATGEEEPLPVGGKLPCCLLGRKLLVEKILDREIRDILQANPEWASPPIPPAGAFLRALQPFGRVLIPSLFQLLFSERACR